MAKQIFFDIDARNRMKRGVDTLANAVKVTLLPREGVWKPCSWHWFRHIALTLWGNGSCIPIIGGCGQTVSVIILRVPRVSLPGRSYPMRIGSALLLPGYFVCWSYLQELCWGGKATGFRGSLQTNTGCETPFRDRKTAAACWKIGICLWRCDIKTWQNRRGIQANC